jgi:hypothetical protein
MRTTKRFEQSATKLYNAFNEGTLNAFDCEHCGVGSLVEKGQGWTMHYREGGNIFSSKGSCETYDMFKAPYHKDYSEEEIFNVEKVFLTEWVKAGKLQESDGKEKEIQFDGLMAVLNYLAELDNINSIEYQYKKFKTVIMLDYRRSPSRR